MSRSYLFDVDSLRNSIDALNTDFPDYVSTLLQRAGDACEHRFVLAGNNPAGSPFFCGHTIDWHVSPNGDREGLFTLNRHSWFFDLARAWILTGTERFRSVLLSQWLDWIQQCPVPNDGRTHFHDYSPWKVLNAAIRVSDFWLPSYHLLAETGSMSPEAGERILSSFHEHGVLLAEHVFDTTHNHTIKEMGALLALALYFPEFPEADAWRDCAMTALYACAADQILPDGVHVEATPAYHKIAMDWFLRVYAQTANGEVTWPADFVRRLESMAAFAWASSFPDGTTVPIGDSDRNALEKWSSDRDYIGRLVERLLPGAPVPHTGGSDPDLLWVTGTLASPASGGGSRDPLPVAYPDGGFFLLQDDETYAIVRNGPMNHGHPHADLLSLLVYRGGTVWLTDTGKYTYNETPRRKYLKSTRAHNTVSIDWEDQAPYRDRMSFTSVPRWENRVWQDTDEYAFLEASHDGYTRLPMPVTHTRQIVLLKGTGLLLVDRFDGEGDHLFDQFFHLPWQQGVELSRQECVCSHGPDAMYLQWPGSQAGILSMRTSWVSPAYGERVESTAVRYRLEARAPASIVTWISFIEGALQLCDMGERAVHVRTTGGVDIHAVPGSVCIRQGGST